MTSSIYEAPESDVTVGESGTVELTMAQVLFSFNGRIGRKTYWLTFLAVFFGLFILLFAVGVSGAGEAVLGVVTLVAYIPALWISLAIQAKRWHDRDKSAWWILINLVPVIGGLWALIENGFLAGDEGANRFGLPSA